MTRSYSCSLIVGLAVCGCDRGTPTLESEQREARRELFDRQSGERRVLALQQANERDEDQREAHGELADESGAVRARRAELTSLNAELADTVARACVGVLGPDTCPLTAARIESYDEIPNGITFRLQADHLGRAEVERRIACYRARTTLRGAPIDGVCIIDLAGRNVDVGVAERGDRVEVTLVSGDATWMERLRNAGRRLRANLVPTRAVSPN